MKTVDLIRTLPVMELNGSKIISKEDPEVMYNDFQITYGYTVFKLDNQYYCDLALYSNERFDSFDIIVDKIIDLDVERVLVPSDLLILCSSIEDANFYIKHYKREKMIRLLNNIGSIVTKVNDALSKISSIMVMFSLIAFFVWSILITREALHLLDIIDEQKKELKELKEYIVGGTFIEDVTKVSDKVQESNDYVLDKADGIKDKWKGLFNKKDSIK